MVSAALAEAAQRLRLRWPLFRTLLFPGVVLHEFSHLLACWITFTPLYDVKLFDPGGGGHVTHGRSRIPLIGPLLISTAPLLGGLAMAAFALWGLSGGEALASWSAVSDLASFGSTLISTLRQLPWLSPWTYLFLFLLLNAGIAIAPSWQDLRNARWGLAALAALGAVSLYWPRLGGWMTANWLRQMLAWYVLADFILLLAVLFWAVMYFLRRLARR